MAEVVEFVRRADCRVELGGVDYVVAVRAARASLEDWRGVEIGDAERMEVVNDGKRVGEAKAPVELYAISGSWNSHYKPNGVSLQMSADIANRHSRRHFHFRDLRHGDLHRQVLSQRDEVLDPFARLGVTL